MSSDKTTPAPTLYADMQEGRIVCPEHLGNYGTQAIKAAPLGETVIDGRPAWVTPLDVWYVFNADDQADFAAEVGYPAECESCYFDRRIA